MLFEHGTPWAFVFLSDYVDVGPTCRMTPIMKSKLLILKEFFYFHDASSKACATILEKFPPMRHRS